MTASPADVAYATYMLNWIEKLDWPQLPIADETLLALRGFWRDSVDTDLDAISDRLWAWVDANGGPQPPKDRRMILARMLICLAAAPNRELEEVGYFEDLLRAGGVLDAEFMASKPPRAVVPAASEDPLSAPVPAVTAATASTAPHQHAKTQVLWAFAAISFISGANPVIAMSADTVRLIELTLVFAMVFLIFLWYRIDADERGFKRTPLLNVAIVMAAALAIPYYLIRSRGWQEGPAAVLQALLVFLGSIVLSAIGAMVFGHVA